MLICLEEPFIQPALEHLDKYIKLSRVNFDRLEHFVYFDLEGQIKAGSEDEWSIPQNKGQLLICRKKLEANVDEEEFTLFRLNHNIPVQGIDYTDQMLLNVSTEHFVSFTKGCFLGQEPVAKVYHRSKPSWKLCVKYSEDCSEEEKVKMTSKVTDPESGRIRGFCFIKSDA